MSEKTTDDVRITALEKAVDEIKEDIKAIKDNHLRHIQDSMATMANDMDWIKRFFWLVASVSLTAIIGAVLGLVLK
jgi:ElaB/YqjD/DUF883 family membrane-anchored ribosome-binding protein